jgi:cytochrome c oxidase subunit II
MGEFVFFDELRSVEMRVLFALMLLPLAGTVAAADVAAGKSLYTTCAACHQPDGSGNQSLNAPRLAGQEGWYLKRQLEAFKSGLRGTAAGDVYGAQMRPMAMTLTDAAAVDNVVAYVETLTAPPAAATVTGDATVGKQLYATCAACHGPDGKGNLQLNAPRLAGQSDWYLVRQLKDFKSGLRGSQPNDTFGMQMKPMAAMLASDQAIDDVVAYIETLK